jgi:hypothetical protein
VSQRGVGGIPRNESGERAAAQRRLGTADAITETIENSLSPSGLEARLRMR